MSTLKELRDIRIEKLNKLRSLGVDPYPAKSQRNIDNQKIHDDFENLNGKEVIAAGRIVSIRTHGKLAFIDVKDQTGKVQLYIKEENLSLENNTFKIDRANSELEFADLNLLDNGDFVE